MVEWAIRKQLEARRPGGALPRGVEPGAALPESGARLAGRYDSGNSMWILDYDPNGWVQAVGKRGCKGYGKGQPGKGAMTGGSNARKGKGKDEMRYNG